MSLIRKTKNKTLETKTLQSVTAILLGLSLAIGGVSVVYSSKLATETSRELTEEKASRVIEDITVQVNAIQEEVAKIASHCMQFIDDPFVQKFLGIRAGKYDWISEIYLTQSSNGLFLTTAEGDVDQSKYNKESNWYKRIEATPTEVVFGDIVYDETENTLFMELGSGMTNYKGDFGGALVVKVNLGSVLQSLEETVTGVSEPFLIDDQGRILFHIDPTLKPTGPSDFASIQEVGSKELLEILKKPEATTARYHYDSGEEVILSKSTLANNWTLGYETTWDSIIEPVRKQTIAVAFTAILAGLASLIILKIQLRSKLNPIQEITNHVDRLAQGDLTVEPLTLATDTELDVLGRGINSLVDNLNNVISMAKNVSGTALSTTEHLAKVADTNASASSEIADTISDVADGVSDQTETCVATNKSVQRLEGEMSEILKNVTDTLKSVTETIKRTKEGTAIVEDLTMKNNMINDEMTKVSEKVAVLIESIKNISTISEDIEAISNQTHLLSLNASIEAARAGEQGKGFAVVASEIRQLSESTAESNNKVAEISKSLIADILDIEEKTKNSMDSLSLQNKSVSDSKETFTEIDKDVAQINNLMNAIEKSISLATEQTTEVARSLTELTSVSEKNTAYSQEIAAKTEEQLKEMESMKTIISELQDTCVELETTVNHFKTENN